MLITAPPANHWRTSRILALSVAAIDILASIVCALLYALNRGSALALLTTLAFALVPLSGAVIIASQPRNPVGWLATAIGYNFVIGDLLIQYSIYALITHPGVLPLGGAAVWIGSWSWMVVFSLVGPFLLLIPDGRLISRHWRALIWVSAATTLPVVIFSMLFSASIDPAMLLKSQIYSTPLDGPGALLYLRIVEIWQPLQSLIILLAAVQLFVRFKHSQGVERQQLKWFFLPIISIPLAAGLGFLTGINSDPLINGVYQVMNLISAFAFPVALAFAVTRYRLYDIDVIIRRTLVYFSLTLILVSVYLGSVILLQGIFTLLTGQHSTVSVVISTLVIAALFSPLRQRIQTRIDYRFFRAKYDTQLAFERFASRQKDTVNLDKYHTQLLGVVEEILHPEFVSLFLVKASEIHQITPTQRTNS